MRPTPFATEYTISMLEDDLMDALPGNRILSAEPGKFVFAHHNGVSPTTLQQSVLRAISEHVQTHRSII